MSDSEMEFWDETEQNLREMYDVARLNQINIEEDFQAAQRDIVMTDYRLDLKASTVETIEKEMEDSPNDMSDRLRGITNKIETLGLTFLEYSEGKVFVQATYDRRDGGSI